MVHQYCIKGYTETHNFTFTWQGLDSLWHGYQSKNWLCHQNEIKDSRIILVCRLQAILDILFHGSCSWIKEFALHKPCNIFQKKKSQPPKLLGCWILDSLKSKPNMPIDSLTLCIAQQQFCFWWNQWQWGFATV